MKNKTKKPSWVMREDKEAEAIWHAIESGELKPVRDKERIVKATETAKKTLQKDARINIRLPQQDVTKIKQKAGALGLPYQTFIASILHQYANDSLKSTI